MEEKPKKRMSESLKDFLNSDAFKNQKKILEEKRKTIKVGDNVIHIEYYEGILDKDDLEGFSIELKKNAIELSSFDKSGVAYNSLEDYTNMVFLALNSELTKNIIYAVAGNVVWETIKIITKKIFSKSKNRTIDSYSGKGQTVKKEITFGINLSLDENTGFNFRLDNKFTTETIDKPLNQAAEFLKTQTPNDSFNHPLFLYYDHKNEKWISVNMMDDIRQKHFSPPKKEKKTKSTKRKKKK